MPTKYDVFAKIIENAPCTESDLGFQTSVTKHLQYLQKQQWIQRIGNQYNPIKNTTTSTALAIIKYCIKNNLNYNHFFSRNLPLILTELYRSMPNRRPIKLKNNKDILEVLTYLETNQFILISQKRPALGTILKHQLLTSIDQFFSIKIRNPDFQPLIKYEQIEKLKKSVINPFEKSIFSFLAGSAQLEGATVSEGETMELILKDIYPDKPQKDIQMVKNLNEALHYIINHIDEEITQEHIKQINKAVMFSLHRNAGEYKKIDNKIRHNPNFKTTSWRQVPIVMEEYCQMLKLFSNKENILNNLGFIHNELQRIHPFSDGNSRTTRMVLNWILAKNHLPLVVLKKGSFDTYMSLTKLSKKRDDELLTKLMWAILWHEQLRNN